MSILNNRLPFFVLLALLAAACLPKRAATSPVVQAEACGTETFDPAEKIGLWTSDASLAQARGILASLTVSLELAEGARDPTAIATCQTQVILWSRRVELAEADRKAEVAPPPATQQRQTPNQQPQAQVPVVLRAALPCESMTWPNGRLDDPNGTANGVRCWQEGDVLALRFTNESAAWQRITVNGQGLAMGGVPAPVNDTGLRDFGSSTIMLLPPGATFYSRLPEGTVEATVEWVPYTGDPRRGTPLTRRETWKEVHQVNVEKTARWNQWFRIRSH